MSIPSAYERALERTAHIAAEEPKKDHEPVAEVPATFEECRQAWFVTSDPVHKDEMLFGWNAAIEAAAQIVEWPPNEVYEDEEVQVSVNPEKLGAVIRARKAE